MRSISTLLLLTAVLLPPTTGRSDASPPTTDTPLRLPEAPRIVAIGDLHGDLDAARRALRLAGAIDEEDRWVGGELVVVQTGDQLDRGDEEQAIVDLFVRLAVEATATGGAVHALLGNHELMNVGLDLRYVTDGGYADFEDAVTVDTLDSTLAAHAVEHRARVVAFRPGGPYAVILAPRQVVLVVGDNVFVHGGILPAHLEYGLDRLNREVRAWLLGEGSHPEGLLRSPSPVWARAYSSEVDADDCLTLASVLDELDAARMVVGHSVQEDGITSYCDDRVWCIDVGMASAYGGPVEVLEITVEGVRILREADRLAPTTAP